MAGDDNEKIGNIEEEAQKYTRIGSLIAEAIQQLNRYGKEVNRTFGQMRQRISETVDSIASATPIINRLGGTALDATKVINDVSIATRKNVVATSETIGELFATSKVLNREIGGVVSSMTNVGISFENVQETLIDGINYVQSVGLNVEQVMGDVIDNMEYMNRFNFEGGVIGLTKMAAQSAMLRVSMRDTAGFADKVMDPEGAIRMSAAFQRLGITMGTLADPFAMMNASIMDPAGLQKAIAQATERFTEFDEKTKSFKINPEGIRFLKEIERETGISYENLSKMGLAAANSDRIMSQMRFGGNLTEEQKMYVASMAQLSGTTGEYMIKIKDETGKEYYEKLSNISEEQLKATIEAQEKAPKTMEDIAHAQLQAGEMAANYLAEIRNRLVYGVAGAQPLRELPELTRSIAKAAGETMREILPEKQTITGGTEKAIDYLKENLMDVFTGKKSMQDVGQDLLKSLKDQGIKVTDNFQQISGRLMDNMYEALSRENTSMSRKLAEQLRPGSKSRDEFEKGFKSATTYGQVMKSAQTAAPTTNQVNHTGNINWNIRFSSDGSTDPNLDKKIDALFRDPLFIQKLQKMIVQTPDATGQNIEVTIKK